MTDGEREHYREVATEIRELFSVVRHPEAAQELRLLADRYERLADYLEEVADSLLLRRQAG
jgi:hypothetical protein